MLAKFKGAANSAVDNGRIKVRARGIIMHGCPGSGPLAMQPDYSLAPVCLTSICPGEAASVYIIIVYAIAIGRCKI